MTNPETGFNFNDFPIEADNPEEVEAAKNVLASCFRAEMQELGIKVETLQTLSTRRAQFARLLDLPTD